MPSLTIAPDGSHLLSEGHFFPYVADTAWSAFADATEAEWVHYLSYRSRQGFTSVAISVLPILHDRTLRDGSREPFALDGAGHYDFARPDQIYFDTARRFVELAGAAGLRPTLVVLWCNYVEGTWGAARTPWAVMPADARRAYLTLVAETFGPLQPVLAISGDDWFDAPAAIMTYLEELEQLSVEAPDCLLTLHSGPVAQVPDEIADSPHLDFITYQSGHEIEHPDRCWTLAQRYRRRAVRKPVVNLEPVYERHGYGGGLGRYTAADVRRAIWTSILAGASAGFGYGAHGIWQWHREGGEFTSPAFSMEPFAWQSALQFRGGDDAALTAYVLQRHGLFRLDLAQQLLTDERGGFRAGAGDGVVAVFLPFAREVRLLVDLSAHRCAAWDLEQRTPIVPNVTDHHGQTVIRQLDVPGDALIVFER